MRSGERGYTLFHCLIFLGLVAILAPMSYDRSVAFRTHTFQSHYGRTAEALADGALETALTHLEKSKGEWDLTAVLATGAATLSIRPTDREGEWRVVYGGEVFTEKGKRSKRTYSAIVSASGESPPVVISLARLTGEGVGGVEEE